MRDMPKRAPRSLSGGSLSPGPSSPEKIIARRNRTALSLAVSGTSEICCSVGCSVSRIALFHIRQDAQQRAKILPWTCGILTIPKPPHLTRRYKYLLYRPSPSSSQTAAGRHEGGNHGSERGALQERRSPRVPGPRRTVVPDGHAAGRRPLLHLRLPFPDIGLGHRGRHGPDQARVSEDSSQGRTWRGRVLPRSKWRTV